MKLVQPLAALVALAILAPTGALAQEMERGSSGTQSLQEAQVADLQDMKEKFMALAEAFPAETWDWRPMEGVRSVRDQLMLVAAEGYLFPTMWGYEAPEGVKTRFGEELARLSEFSREEVIAEIGKSYDHLIGLCEEMTEEDRARPVNFFGRQVELATAITLMANDMHEHLGKTIAYARTNEVVPPWSMQGG